MRTSIMGSTTDRSVLLIVAFAIALIGQATARILNEDVPLPDACALLPEHSALCSAEVLSARRSLRADSAPPTLREIQRALIRRAMERAQATMEHVAQLKAESADESSLTHAAAVDCVHQISMALDNLENSLDAVTAAINGSQATPKSLHSDGRPMFPADLTASVDDLPYLLTSARANIDGCVEGLQEFAPDALDTAPGIQLQSEVTLITVTVTAAHACVPCAIDDELSASAGGDSSADYSVDNSADAYEYDYASSPSRRITTETDQSGDSGAPGWVTPGIFEHLKRIQAVHMCGGDAGVAPDARRLLGSEGAERGDDAGEAAAQSDSIRRRLTGEGMDSAYSGDAVDSRESGDTLRRGLQSSSNGKLSQIGGSSSVKVGGTLDTSGFNGQYNSLLPPRINAIVAKDGSGTHKTLKAAIASAPSKGTFVIFIKAGVYTEQILFDNQGIVLVGEGMGKTIITNNKNVVGGSTTFNSATIGANKGMFTALGITVRNTAGVVGQQAVALRSEDLSAFFECEFDGNQDTLYPHSGRQYFRNCKVGGTVDFIFGKGAAVFDRPQIRLHKDDPVIITAPQNDPTYPEPKGIIIRNAVITADAGVGKAYLGRPWTNTGKAIFINCFLPKEIQPEGWTTWDTDTVRLARKNGVYFAEFQSTGPGARMPRASWVFPQTIVNPGRFTAEKFLGWTRKGWAGIGA
ncbi:unnamed protein product [Closterium sp. Yama58-4]|nr:unnamed protein product [Closterium sp. Yama58-4]